jgi:type I restriction enzyme S subunit
MKKGWQTKKVSEIAKHSLGKMLDKAKNKGEPQPYLRNLNVRWFDFDLSDVLEMPFLPTEVEKYTAVKGDVLICEGGYPGRAAIWEKDEPIYFQKALHRVRFHEPERNRWFLYYLLSKDLDGTLKNHFNGAGIQHFTGEALAQFEVPLPPLAEQQRIVGLLDEAFEGLATAKANAEKNLQNARALFESHLQSVFTQRGPGWLETTLGEVIEIVGGSQPPKSVFSKTKKADNIRLIQIRDYKSDKHVVFIPRDQARRFCNADDVMIGRYGPPLFQILRGIEGAYNVALMKAVPDEAKLSRDFLFYFLKHSAILQYVIYHSSRAAGQIGVTKETLEPYPIALPSLEEQEKVVETIQELETETQRLARLYERKHAALEALKKSLLHQAFTGEL